MSININPDTTSVSITAASNTITVVDTANSVNVSTSQPITSVVTVAIPGPQGPAGTGVSIDTGSFATTGSNSFIGNQVITGSLTVSGSSTFTNIGPAVFSGSVASTQGFTGSLQGTASYALNTGATIDTGSFATTGSNTFIGNQTIEGSLTIATPSAGIPDSLSNWNGQGGWNQGFYSNLITTGGTGTGLTVDVAAGGEGYISIEVITINTPGSGYTDGDVITIDNENNLPGTFTIGTAAGNSWLFDTSGSLTAPGDVNVSGTLHIITPDPATNFTAIDFRNPDYGIYGKSNSINARGNTLEFTATDYNINGDIATHEVLTLRPEGRVGIGTTNPSSTLEVIGDQIISGSLFISGATEFGGNLVPKTARGATLGTSERPFSEIYVSSGSINIASDIPGDPDTTLTNIGGNILISAGGMRLVGDASFIAATGSFQYISGSMTQIGNYNQIGTSTTVGNQTITGSIDITGTYKINGVNVLTGSQLSVDSITFDRTAGINVTEGQMAWNNSDGTLDIGLNYGDVVLQVGQEQHFVVRNETGVVIENGTAVYASGVTAGSKRIEASPFTADGSVREVRFLGLATHDISNGVNGIVSHFGYVRGLDTRGTSVTAISVGDETWAEGDILYAHPTAAGKLTNVPPKHKIYVAIITTRHQNTGVLFVRPSSYGHVDDIHDVAVNTGSLSTGDLFVYNSTSENWENTKILSGSYEITGSLSIEGNQTISGSLTISGSISGGGIVTSSNVSTIQTITSASYAGITPVSGTLYIIIG